MLLFSFNKMSPEAHIKHKKEHAYFCKGPMKLKNSVPTKVEIKPTPLARHAKPFLHVHLDGLSFHPAEGDKGL